MGPAGKGINIQISEQAASFIKSRRVNEPVILVNLGFRSSGGQASGGCGGGGCGDEGSSGPQVGYLNAILVDGGKPGADFVRVETAAGIPVYLAKQVYAKAARQHGNTLIVTVKGLVMKKLNIEGLDLTSEDDQSSQGESSCP